MLEFINDKKKCTGCAACFNICPVNCIAMTADPEGFRYPVADGRCINCGKCKKVCPLYEGQAEKVADTEQYSVAAVSKNKNTWLKSSSGGAFTEICNAYCDSDTVVFGAKFDELRVEHSYVVGIKNIDGFRKSKYVQSDIGDSFTNAKHFLQKGKKVIFSGTPCQIAGLKNFLGKEYPNLLCIDFICHGVGSPKVFEKCLLYLENKYHQKIKSYSFRYKRVIMGNFREYVSKYTFENNKNFYSEQDEYTTLFLQQLCIRKSCGVNCKFRSSNRMSDITIADFKNKIDVFFKDKNYQNYSTIIVNSKKGDMVCNQLYKYMEVYPCSLDSIEKNNPLFFRTTPDNPLRDSFFEDFENGMEIEALLHKYAGPQKKMRFRFLKDLFPYRVHLWYIKFNRGKKK